MKNLKKKKKKKTKKIEIGKLKCTLKLDPDKRAQLKRGKNAAVTNVECAKFVVTNGCKCGKNMQRTMMFV